MPTFQRIVESCIDGVGGRAVAHVDQFHGGSRGWTRMMMIRGQRARQRSGFNRFRRILTLPDAAFVVARRVSGQIDARVTGRTRHAIVIVGVQWAIVGNVTIV